MHVSAGLIASDKPIAKIANNLHLPVALIADAIQFLIGSGLIEKKQNGSSWRKRGCIWAAICFNLDFYKL